jgi:hypothetical protein
VYLRGSLRPVDILKFAARASILIGSEHQVEVVSAGSSHTAIISLGMSCQSSRQIRTSLDVLSAALGETIERERHFFDGLIAPVGGMAALFEDDFPLFTRDQIEPGPGHPTWQPYGIRFLHHFRQEDEDADIDAHLDEELSRFGYLREKFADLTSRRRVVFVVSNSQNNLTEVAEETEMGSIAFQASELSRLQTAVDRFLGRACEYLVVSYPDRHGEITHPELTVLQPDDSEWTGDKVQWHALFQDYFDRPNRLSFAV